MPRKRENKKKSFQCVSTRLGKENSKKIAKKFKKLKKKYYGFFSSQDRLRKAEKEREKKKNHFDGCPPDP